MNKRILTHLIGIAVFAFILTRIDIRKTISIIATANPYYLLAAAAMIAPVLTLEALRWHYILGELGYKYRFRETYGMFASSLYIGFVTPARLGEFVRVYYLKGQSMGTGLVSVFIDRATDLGFVFAIGYLGMFYFPSALQKQIFWASIAAASFITAAAMILLNKGMIIRLLDAIFHKIVPEKNKSDIKNGLQDFHNGFTKLISPRRMMTIGGITALSWLFYYTQVYILAKALGMEATWIHVATAVSVSSLMSILPISISGIGTRDAAYIFFFGIIGIGNEYSVALSLLVLMLMAIVAVSCFPFWLRNPARLLEGSEKPQAQHDDR